MSDLVLRLARPGEDARIADFINQNFDMRLPLINRADFYQFYYAHTPGAAPQFALAEQDGEILCAAGYILANQSETPDIWVSVWVAAKGHNGVGLELMDALSGLLNARVVAAPTPVCCTTFWAGRPSACRIITALAHPVQRAGSWRCRVQILLPCRYRMTCR